MAPLPLLAHLLQLKLHAAPHAAQIDRHDAIIVIARIVGPVSTSTF